MNGWMLRACFWLLAAVILSMLVLTEATVFGCLYMVLSGRSEIGACAKAGITDQIREIMSEVLTAVLALLLATRGPPPSPPRSDES
jgi:hypothetical protein